MVIRSLQTGLRDVGARPCHGVLLELHADQLERREAPGHRDQPTPATTVDVDHAATIRQVDDELREGGEGLLEEDRDVLGREVLDGDAVAVGAIGDGGAGPGRKNSTIPPQSARRPSRG